jgi:glycosyltransferase involved in cell wall biosynthesis
MYKILYVDSSLAIHGGMERVLTDKISWLATHGGCEVTLLTVCQGSHPLAFPLPRQVTHRDLGVMLHRKYKYSGLRRLREELRLNRLFNRRLTDEIQAIAPDVLICARLDFVRHIVKAKGRVPFVFESHNSCLAYRFERYSWLQRLRVLYNQYMLRHAWCVVALTEGDASEWRRRVPRVKVIPNIVTLNPTGRYSECSAKSAIFVGRYSYQKDIDALFRIWSQVHQRHDDWQLHVYGDYGGHREELEGEARRLSAGIVIHQPTTAIFDAYVQSSMLLLTSRYEPFGLVIPEAMSCGLPVVAFDCPYGPAGIITDGRDGFLVIPGDTDAFAARICQLIEHPEHRRLMGGEGVQKARRYAADIIMPQWLQVFKEITE